MYDNFNKAIIEFKPSNDSCPTWCNWCTLTWWVPKIITEVPDNVKKTTELLLKKIPTNSVKIWEDILNLDPKIDLSSFDWTKYISFSSKLYKISKTKDRLMEILSNPKHNFMNYVWISYMNPKGKFDINKFNEYMNSTIKNAGDFLEKNDYLKIIQNIYWSNDINKNKEQELVKKAHKYFFNKSREENTLYSDIWTRENGLNARLGIDDLKWKIELVWRYLDSHIENWQVTEKTLEKMLKSKWITISLFPNFVMLEHSVGTVNDKNLRIDYDTFNKMVEKGNLKKSLLKHISPDFYRKNINPFYFMDKIIPTKQK